MSHQSASVVTGVVNRELPRVPHSYGLMNEQCSALVDTMDDFVQYTKYGGKDKARKVQQIEQRSDVLKILNLDIRNHAFAELIYQDEIYRAILSLDMAISYAMSTRREMEALGVLPDQFILEIAIEYKTGAMALRRGFKRLTSNPAQAAQDASVARKVAQNVGLIYRRALDKLFCDNTVLSQLDASETDTVSHTDALHDVLEMMRQREIYHHLSDGADCLTWAADRLHDIAVKNSLMHVYIKHEHSSPVHKDNPERK